MPRGQGLMTRGHRGDSALWAVFRSIKRGHDGGPANSRGRVTKREVSARGGSRASARAGSTRKLYTLNEYPTNERAGFWSVKDWEAREEKLVNRIKRVDFGDDFPIRDEHTDTIIAKGPSFCQSLLHFEAGDAETGKGAGLSDEAVVRFASACPNLIHVKLDGARYLGDESLLAFLTHCPDLQYIQMSGNDKCTGQVKGPALQTLAETPTMGKKLVKMRLTDQGSYEKTFQKAAKALSTKRKRLPIEVGCTHEREAQYISTWLGGKDIFRF